MRVDSIISINANTHHTPHTADYSGISAAKTKSGIAFEEYLKANMQDLSKPVVSRQTENQLAGLLIGYITPLKITQKETKAESNVS